MLSASINKNNTQPRPAEKKVLVTGAGGFVGNHLIKELLTSGYDISVTSYSPNQKLISMLGEKKVSHGDLTDRDYTDKLIQSSNPEIIFHLASISIVQGSEKMAHKILTNNIALQYNMLESTKTYAPKARFIAICSAAEYGMVKQEDIPIDELTPLHPVDPYAISKLTQDYLSQKYFLSDKMDVVILRPFNHTGEGKGPHFVVPALAKQIAEIETGKSLSMKVGNLESTRDFTDVKDVVKAYILAAEKCKSGEIYNIGSGKGVRIQEILDTLIKLSTSKIKVERDESRMRPSDIPVLIADYSKFNQITGWQPEIPLEKTLERVLNYWRQQINK